MQEPTLHELVNSYRSGAEPREAVMKRVAELMYKDPSRFGFDSEDDAADALERHGSRIAALADRYEDRGISFDFFLRKNLKYLARTMRRERRLGMERDRVCERACSDYESSIRAEESNSLPRGFRMATRTRSQGRLISPPVLGKPRALAEAEIEAFASRLVFLSIKCAWEIDDELAGLIAGVCGVEPDWLGSALAQARRSLESERCHYERLVLRRNGSWCRLRLLESRLRNELDMERKRRDGEAIERERARLERARAELAAFRPIVPNSVVARILGVPKGTVDSGLYYLKRRSRALARAEASPKSQ